MLTRYRANILFPKPGFPEARCGIMGLEVRHFDLLQNRTWEVDVDAVEARLSTQETHVEMCILISICPCWEHHNLHVSWIVGVSFKFLLAIYVQSILGICYCRLHKQQRGMKFLQSQMRCIATTHLGATHLCPSGHLDQLLQFWHSLGRCQSSEEYLVGYLVGLW